MLFQILILVSLPFGDPSTLVAHGSPPGVLTTAAVVGVVSVASNVGNGKGVLVARGVCVGASVGGRGVAVGIASWVCATIVYAAAMAVFWTSTGLTVGTGSAPHALMIIAIATITVSVEKRFMFYEYLLVNLTIRKAAASGFDAVISDDNFPVPWCDSEAAEGFHILFAGDEGCGAVLPNRPGEAIAGYD